MKNIKKKKRKKTLANKTRNVLVVRRPGEKYHRLKSFGNEVFLPGKSKRTNYAMPTNKEVRDMCSDFKDLSDDEINEMREMFNMLDGDGDGAMDIHELEHSLKGLKLLPSDPLEAKERTVTMMRVADHNFSGNILFGEFVGLCVDIGYTKPMSNVEFKVDCSELFDIFGGGGRLTVEVMQEKLKFITGERYSKESVVKILNAVDENNDGLITLAEFSEIIKFGENTSSNPYFKYY